MAISMIIDENKLKRTIFLLMVCFFLSFLGHFPALIEKYYSGLFYPFISKILRISFGWLPFSLGDYVYLLIVCLLLFIGIKKYNQCKTLHVCFNFSGLMYLLSISTRCLCWVYIVFKTLWGFNYDRQGIASQLFLDRKAYSKAQIVDLTKKIILQANSYRRLLIHKSLQDMSVQEILNEAHNSYDALCLEYPFLVYQHASIKETLYTPIADYVGFTGYYNPFTGEAHIRKDVPSILLPFIVCHEIAHQIGYSSESEANFVGFLAASNSKNPFFQYATYLELLNYAINEEYMLYAKDNDFKGFKTVLDYNVQHIDTLVKKDRKQIRDFFFQRKNNILPVSNSLFDQFLKMNKQVSGIASYNEVLGWLLAYKAKYGKN